MVSRPVVAQSEPAGERVYAGLSLAVARPIGEFRNFVAVGGGFAGSFTFNPTGGRLLGIGIRLDASGIIYGEETQRVPLSETVQRVLVDVTTSNSILALGIGPQVMLGRGPVRVYGYGGVGFSYFATTSSVKGSGDWERFASTTNFDDLTASWYSGTGILIRVSQRRNSVFIDLGTRYVGNGRARYLKEGSLREAPGGGLLITPIESETNLMLFHLGVSVGVGKDQMYKPRSRRRAHSLGTTTTASQGVFSKTYCVPCP